MKAILITVGSRGDAEPFLSLAKRLSAKGHSVELFLQPQHNVLIDTSSSNSDDGDNITLHPLPFSTNDFYKFMNPSQGADNPNPRVKFIGVVTDIIAQLIFPCWERVLQQAQNGADVIVCSSLARPLAIAIAKKVQIPVSIVHLQPLAPTGYFPHYSTDSVEAVLNMKEQSEAKQEFEETYITLERYQHEFLQKPLADLYEKLGLDMIDFENGLLPTLKGQNDSAIIVNAYPQQLVPACPDAGPNSFHIGALADTTVFPESWTPPQDLVDFLERSEAPPVCVGFGSMPFNQTATILEALEQFQENAIVVGMALGGGGGDDDVLTISPWAKEHVLALPGGASYPWLLPRCSVMVCHGGAGVVNATMRAGIPCVVAPLIGDQFFWAPLLEQMGLGAQAASNLMALEAKTIVEALEKARKCQQAAKRMGEDLGSGPVGVDVFVDLLEQKTK